MRFWIVFLVIISGVIMNKLLSEDEPAPVPPDMSVCHYSDWGTEPIGRDSGTCAR